MCADLECLYRFQESGYYNPIVEPPEPAFVIRGIPTPSPPPSRPATSHHSARRGAQSSTQRPKSVPVPKFRPVPKLNIPTPMQAWKKSLAETSWGVATPGSTPTPQPVTPHPPSTDGHDEKEESKPQVHWPTQVIMSKYDRPYEMTAGAEEVFDTPLPPRDPGSGGDSGYVFIPTGDGGVEVHSPPLHWPDSDPRPPTPQHSVSSKASLGSVEGIMTRKRVQEQYHQQALKEQEEKKKQVERQRRFEKLVRQHQQQQMRKSQAEPPKSAASARSSPNFRRERVKSATIHRNKTAIPQRPVCSARPSRPASDTVVYNENQYQGKTSTTAHTTLHKTTWEEERESMSPIHRPWNPLPPSPSLEDLVIEEDRSPSPDYQETVDKYGWRAEVHGDPYNIKKTTKRLPYTVKCAEPVLAPEPPKVHMESKETFFLNTIPRRKATFDVQQEWLSEGLHAKRIELQKRDGVNYRYKTFGFAY